ncbi:HD domain-containing protein [Serpentinicella sp. ANB-PHB4]|uniref:HD domain-containing protein n=1 Tax=Serpentinicella sp. ANB-PHB4 TaxID=3074076 RepID=UPI00285FA08A|nr:HD domain-containing protein [Serpentinicella sp. ANB-PHB4]MDR5658634.1 HD domain-containing protein [Serpentinicella sp. ANB-PHB4]
MITYQEIIKNEEVRTYIEKGDELLGVLGFTEHAVVHAGKTAQTAASILLKLGYTEREAELARIAGYTHDIGNMINRVEHAQTGAVIAFNILTRLGMEPEEIAIVVSAIGNHDEETGTAVNNVSAALILSDKTDVRRSRVRNTEFVKFDIHDRVNYAVVKSEVHVDEDKRAILLDLTIDTNIISLMEYFEIFMKRMIMCRRAADFLNARFELVMNGTKLI